MAMNEAKETFAPMLRWTEQPKNAQEAEKTIFKGTSINGYYTGKKEKVGVNESVVYEITMKTGEKVSFWGSSLLDGKFNEIPMNCEVVVECLGVAQPKTPKGRPYMNFKVMFDKDSTKPANLTEAAPSTAAAPVQAQQTPAAAAPAAAPAPAASDAGF